MITHASLKGPHYVPFSLTLTFASSLPYRGQEQHIRYEHIYLTEPNSQSEVEYAEIKRPRLEMGQESLMRHSTHRPPLPLGGGEDMAKVSAPHYVHSTLTTLFSSFTYSS